MDKKKILMPILEAGAGHKMPAIAVRDSIEAMHPGKYQIDVIDFAREVGALKEDKFFKGFWDYSLAHRGFALTSYIMGELLHPLTRAYIPVFHKKLLSKMADYVADYEPDLIFSSHYFALQVSRIVRDRLSLPAKVIGMITDPFQAYSFWCEKKADYIIVASELAKKRAMRHGVPADKIRIFDFPINNKFLKLNRSKDEIMKKYNIDKSKLTVLSSGGGQGIGKIGGFVETIYRRGLPFNVIAVCGRNDTLKDGLEKLKNSLPSQTNLIPLGFVDNMNELLSISDFCIAKAGASTTLEALLMDAPVIFTEYANQAEKPNVDFSIRKGVGWYAPSEKNFFGVLDTILSSDIITRYKQNIKNLGLKSGSDDIASFLVDNI